MQNLIDFTIAVLSGLLVAYIVVLLGWSGDNIQNNESSVEVLISLDLEPLAELEFALIVDGQKQTIYSETRALLLTNVRETVRLRIDEEGEFNYQIKGYIKKRGTSKSVEYFSGSGKTQFNEYDHFLITLQRGTGGAFLKKVS